MSSYHTFVGLKIKGVRESKNLSIEEVAERSGLSAEQITSIESDQNLPSLGPLIKIARALGVRLGTFMDDNDALGPVVCRAEERELGKTISFSALTVKTSSRCVPRRAGITACRKTGAATVAMAALIRLGISLLIMVAQAVSRG